MKKQLAVIILITYSFAQVSVSSINDIANKELDKIRKELKDEKEFDSKETDLEINQDFQTVEINPESKKLDNLEVESDFFGYDFFKKQINFFDNIPTPSNFKLGAGDEIIISLWGETNFRKTYTINKEGLIYFENVGFINLSNKSLSEAENVLTEELAKIYSTLKDANNPTRLMVELDKLKSINVYFTGLVQNPGINLIHPFSDVYSALVQAGGIKEEGSLRKVEIIRSNKILTTVDFYSFFVDGVNSFSDIKLIDGDVIHVPALTSRSQIEGGVVNPGFYELLDSNSLSDLLKYASGLKADASNKVIISTILSANERQSDDSAKSSLITDLSDASKIFLNNGSLVTILPIADNDTDVTVFGQVTFPGDYPAFRIAKSSDNQAILHNTNLREVLDLAGGFEDPIFRKTINDNIVVLRLDEKEFYGKEFNINYKDASNFILNVNDKIFVYQNPNYFNDFSYTIDGEVNKPGTYPLREGLTLGDAIKLAGGVTEIGSINSLTVSKDLLRIDENGDEILETELVANIDLEFVIADKNRITILPKTNVVRVSGNVYNPGLISHQSGRGMSMANAIELAGGYKPNSLKKRAYVVRANGEIDKANIFRGRTKRVYPGDSIFVPLDPNPDEFDITSFIADLSTTLANIAAILLIADNN